jgi:hypothetical protein
MTICWYCHWGWAKPVAEIYKRAFEDLKKLPGDAYIALNYGPAHVVWADENFDSAEWCLKDFDNWCAEYQTKVDLDDEQLAIVKRSLEELAAMPLTEREAGPPDDYDDEHPENYPPTVEVENVRHIG